MSSDLFKAILAMDSYNRGYKEGIKNLGIEGSKIGNYTILRQSDIDEGTPGVNANFYAIAYKNEATGEIIISYRGTDDTGSLRKLYTDGDVLNGWGVGAGNEYYNQALLAFDFYKAIAGEGVDPRGANITLTGHSLGGGLARPANDNQTKLLGRNAA